jgi:hypothetical protein
MTVFIEKIGDHRAKPNVPQSENRMRYIAGVIVISAMLGGCSNMPMRMPFDCNNPPPKAGMQNPPRCYMPDSISDFENAVPYSYQTQSHAKYQKSQSRYYKGAPYSTNDDLKPRIR